MCGLEDKTLFITGASGGIGLAIRDLFVADWGSLRRRDGASR
jgi:NAD(P)-dependent dehydrogenase (short-subunit alcohol dehydrogenase family)